MTKLNKQKQQSQFQQQQKSIIERLSKLGIKAEIGRKAPNAETEYFSVVGNRRDEVIV
ncbi:hypothetical protein [Paenibacillus qinlingensis]|uniref:Uncharacterized protein n=1 Tax=Paenibacillus qinlingensis TaxID=1837343 RepID=A0ABU1P861_9BACL|nr:hypothetical protein [Paenibacillus qinlingensis]MDR6555516.1 hypothetical protein [Paenibacillus qinlingensis]